jgi:hypothetical protein
VPRLLLRCNINDYSQTNIWGFVMKSDNTLVESRNEISSASESYQKPSIRELDEKEVLSAFQVTVAAATWWVM